MKKTMLILFAGLFAAAIATGCATKKVETTEETKPAQKDDIVDYTVKPHDTLWAIASRSSLYNDAFAWPLIFKENRDKIQDPDLIYPKQDFQVDKSVSSDALSQARDLASKTPKYKPHSKPVKLSVDYF